MATERMPQYLRELPGVDIHDDGHVTITVGGQEFVFTMRLYKLLVVREAAKLAEWERAHQGAQIVRLGVIPVIPAEDAGRVG